MTYRISTNFVIKFRDTMQGGVGLERAFQVKKKTDGARWVPRHYNHRFRLSSRVFTCKPWLLPPPRFQPPPHIRASPGCHFVVFGVRLRRVRRKHLIAAHAMLSGEKNSTLKHQLQQLLLYTSNIFLCL